MIDGVKKNDLFGYFDVFGFYPDADQIAEINKIRATWQAFFAAATDARGTINTKLK